MRRKRSTKNQAKNNLTLNFTDDGDKPDYLSMIESISYDVEECGLLFDILSDQESLLSLSDFLFLSHEQAALFSVIAELSLHDDVTIEMLARFFKCKVVRALSLFDQIEALEKSGLVKRIVNTEKRTETYRNLSFTVPKNVMEALRQADQRLLTTNRKVSFPVLLDHMKQLLGDREEAALSHAQLIHEAEDLIAQNKRLPFVNYLNTTLEKTSSKVVAVCLVMDHFNGKMETSPEYFSDILFDNFRDQIEFSRNVHSGRHELIKRGVANLSAGSPHEGRSLVLGADARRLLLVDFPKPDQAVRQQIWLSKLPELTPEMAATLAKRFDLTGGQIDNQVKQLLIKRVLHPDADLLQTLIESCEKEFGFTERKPIGFN